MVFRKHVFGATIAPLFTFNQLKNKEQMNECASTEEVKDQADDLEKIMAEQGGIPDQMEMMEAMMMRGKALKPFPFEQIQNKAAMFKQHEANDGLSLNFDLPLGQTFQLGCAYNLSNKNGASFEYTTSVNNSDTASSHENVMAGNFRFQSDGTGMFMGNAPLPFKSTLQTQIMFNDNQVKDVIQLFNLTTDFKDAGLNYKFQGMQGQGVHSLAYMQSLNKQIQAGWQMNYIGMMGECNFGYCGLWQSLDKSDQFTLAYSPMDQKTSWTAAYIHKFAQKHALQTFVELKGKLDGVSSEFSSGFKKRFKMGVVTGYANSNWQIFSTIQKREQHITMEMMGMLDFKNPKSLCKFGVNLNFSMM